MPNIFDSTSSDVDFSTLQVGDIVLFHVSDGFEYTVRAKVVFIDEHQAACSAEEIFDSATGAQVTGGAILERIGSKSFISLVKPRISTDASE